jgi:hypothetical protein
MHAWRVFRITPDGPDDDANSEHPATYNQNVPLHCALPFVSGYAQMGPGVGREGAAATSKDGSIASVYLRPCDPGDRMLRWHLRQ